MRVTEAAREAYGGASVRWVPVEATGKHGESDLRSDLPDREVGKIAEKPVASAYRTMFWDVGVDPTKRRPAGEALARRLAEGSLPKIHPLVDAYNLVSATTLVPLSAFDSDEIEGELVLDTPDSGDALDAIGEAEAVEPTGEHPVWRDEAGLVAIACYRDSQRTALDADTTDAVVVTLAPTSVPPQVLENTFRKLESYARLSGWRFDAKPETIPLS